jgi:hypothetical protein
MRPSGASPGGRRASARLGSIPTRPRPGFHAFSTQMAAHAKLPENCRSCSRGRPTWSDLADPIVQPKGGTLADLTGPAAWPRSSPRHVMAFTRDPVPGAGSVAQQPRAMTDGRRFGQAQAGGAVQTLDRDGMALSKY